VKKRFAATFFISSPSLFPPFQSILPCAQVKPSFATNFPALKLGKSWNATLYGKKGLPSLKPVPRDHPSHFSHPSLNNIGVDFSVNGEIEFSAPGWKVKFTPNFPLTSPQLLLGDGLQLVRGDDGETGIAFDKKSSRHFFLFGKNPSPPTPKLLLQLEVCVSCRLSVVAFLRLICFLLAIRGNYSP
jgi:hypothetical protein